MSARAPDDLSRGSRWRREGREYEIEAVADIETHAGAGARRVIVAARVEEHGLGAAEWWFETASRRQVEPIDD